MYLIVGLGNPGKEYENNRHNAGFMFIDYLIKDSNFDSLLKKKNYYYSKGIYNSFEAVFIKPTTYMNLSGNAIVSAMGFYKIQKDKIIIIYDDVALPFGKIRIREDGSPGGHNGLKNIQTMIGTDQYKRIRIGVSAPKHPSAMKDYVLGNFSDEEKDILQKNIFPTINESLKFIVSGNIKEAMNKFNGINSK